ncbi:hypothetical protein [Lysobacter sp. TAB13]|uniref:hypothetical protein n=1 Tax=Lysobacter sp. TAB13 TaxID=3233065 RepID=UPI003F96AA0F
MRNRLRCLPLLLALAAASAAAGDRAPKILFDPAVARATLLPDFSYAGYGFGALPLPTRMGKTIDVGDYGARPDDEIDDSKAVLKALDAAHQVKGPVTLRFGAGRYVLSEVLMIRRSHIAIEGAGQGAGGTQLYFTRPLRMVDKSDRLDGLREYLRANNKRQIDRDENIDERFSEYSWSGGFIWTEAPGASSRLEPDENSAAPDAVAAISGQAGEQDVAIASGAKLAPGDVISLRWYSRQGKASALLHELYGADISKVGSRHFEDPNRAVVVQTTQVLSARDGGIRIADPLMHPIGADLPADIAPWHGLQEIGVRDLAIVFPEGQSFGHHLEEGWNGIFLHDVFNGWVDSVRVANADSGIITYDSANLTLRNIRTDGNRIAHYGVQLGSVHNVLATQLQVLNHVRHSLSFNTQCTRSVFQRATVWDHPVLDQHAGANHQNLFDDVTLYIVPRKIDGVLSYPLWDGSGAPYWQPGHGRYNTDWNIRVLVQSGAAPGERVLLTGLDEGPDARVVGVSGNREYDIDYRPRPYAEMINAPVLEVPSLYDWQLARRLGRGSDQGVKDPR